MATSSHAHSRSAATYAPRYRRSAFNGAKQLEAAGTDHRRVLLFIGSMVLALVATLVVVVTHLQL